MPRSPKPGNAEQIALLRFKSCLMAQKIGLLDVHQAATDQPRTFLKKSVAMLMIRRQVAELVAHHTIRILPRTAYLKPDRPTHSFIPSKLPPREIPGCFFQLPQSDTWKLQHRQVRFMQIAPSELSSNGY